jgi:hypothetical protein
MIPTSFYLGKPLKVYTKLYVDPFKLICFKQICVTYIAGTSDIVCV